MDQLVRLIAALCLGKSDSYSIKHKLAIKTFSAQRTVINISQIINYLLHSIVNGI